MQRRALSSLLVLYPLDASSAPLGVAIKYVSRDFPGGPMVKILPSNAEDVGSIPGPRTKIPHALWHSQKKKKKLMKALTG